MNNIISTKFNAIFLAIVLVLGTITLSNQSFITTANAQTEPYYYGERENGYDSYETEPREYPPQYQEREYNSYPTEYDTDDYEKKSYRDDYYEEPREYPSYQPDYEPKYSSYEKDNNNYKSKKDSVSINKLNCINNNVNINGNNTGDINVGNSGRTASSSGTDEGYLGVGSSGGYGEGYDRGYNKEQGVTCIINNNNTNNNFGAGNVTDGNGDGNVIDTCEECFLDVLTEAQIADLEELFAGEGIDILIPPGPSTFITINNFTVFCAIVENFALNLDVLTGFVNQLLEPIDPDPGPGTINELADCIAEVLGIGTDGNGIVAPFHINKPSDFQSDTGSLTSFDINNGGTGDLTATEKITKLKQQWLEQLP